MCERDSQPSLARVDLCIVAGESRSYAGAPAQITIGWVDFGGWQVHLVAATPPMFPENDAYLVKVNYDMGFAPDAPAPTWVEVGFEFDDEGIAVADALPRRVRAPVGSCRYTLSEHLAFDVADATVRDGFPAGHLPRGGIPMPPLDPEIDAFGIGGSHMRWRHKAVPGMAGPTGSQTGWLMLLVPAGCRELHVRACARYASTPRRMAGRRPGATPEVFTVRLPARGSLANPPPAADAGGPLSGMLPGQARASGPSTPPPLSVRMGFVVDVAGYSQRTEPGQYALQQRLATLVTEVMDEVGVQLEPEYVQGTGDGMNVFLPVGTDISRALPALLTPTAALLRRDNQRYSDRIRLRIATDLGPVRQASTGFSGNTIIAFGRLVDSAPIRDAITRHPGADLAVLVSDWLYEYVVSQRYANLDPSEFIRVQAVVKNFQADAWLWTSSPWADPAAPRI